MEEIVAPLVSFAGGGEGKKILIQGIYGPNQDSPLFYSDSVFKKIQDWHPDYSIFAGDFNVVLDPLKDTKNYNRINNPQAMHAIKDQIEQHNLIDVWRELHPDEKKIYLA